MNDSRKAAVFLPLYDGRNSIGNVTFTFSTLRLSKANCLRKDIKKSRKKEQQIVSFSLFGDLFDPLYPDESLLPGSLTKNYLASTEKIINPAH